MTKEFERKLLQEILEVVKQLQVLNQQILDVSKNIESLMVRQQAPAPPASRSSSNPKKPRS